MHKIEIATYKWDLDRLPEDIRLAWIGRSTFGSICRLTETHYSFRPTVGAGPTFIGTLEEILPLLQSMSITSPYVPVRSAPADELARAKAITFTL